MVLVILDSLQFEASKFETRTMPTPDLKGKEVIYWVKVETSDRRLALDLHRFLTGAPRVIELKVPSAFVVAKTELETFWPPAIDEGAERDQKRGEKTSAEKLMVAESEPRTGEALQTNEESRQYVLEVVLRRALADQSGKQAQSPYG